MAGRPPSGLKDFQAKLRKQIREVGGGTDRGLTLSGLKVERDAKANTPVRLGNLRGSGYTVTKEGDKSQAGPFKGEESGRLASLTRSEKQVARGIAVASDRRNRRMVVVGFGAPYAAAVHENPNAGAAGYDPDSDTPDKTAKEVHSRVGGHKFLERALQTNASFILQTLAAEAKIK